MNRYSGYISDTPDGLTKLKNLLSKADTIVIGAGAGLSTSAGFVYSGERFEKYFPDFIERYGFKDMYSGGFYVMDQSPEENWAYWSRYIYINRYMRPGKPVYEKLFELVKDKDYFVITTNVDHCFQRAGFDKQRLFYTQGDYGLWQCSKPCHDKTYDNYETICEMVVAQGFTIDRDGALLPPENGELKMSIPSELISHCPVCGEPMSMNLRADGTFVQDEGWYSAAERYTEFLRRHRDCKTVFLELGVGGNTPVIIKYPFIRMTSEWQKANYVCINYGEAFAPETIQDKAICINGDIGTILEQLG
ncbi:MAG: Sir2 silent information regulator family NAD-dependent deacetylase [Erysipelotrichaceae bacterium]|nr:Sir2 silent information regulator family NAD-dependent deacetylase [Erysipelotrichaceae bacterium]